MDNQYVEGPVNCIRMQGKINDIEKVIYIFFDFHLGVNSQIKCSSFKYKPLTTYLIENIESLEKDKKVDIFLELQPSPMFYVMSKYKKMFLEELRDMFATNFKMEGKKVMSPDKYPQARFHYTDIRDYIKGMEVWRLIDNIANIINNSAYLEIYQINNIKDGLTMATSRLKLIYDALFSTVNIKKPRYSIIPESVEVLSKMKQEDFENIGVNLMKKIRKEYQNPKIKKILNSEVDKLKRDFESIFEGFAKIYTKLEELATLIDPSNFDVLHKDNLKNKYYPYSPSMIKELDLVCEIKRLFIDIYDINHLFLYTDLMDVFVLRRFLDKDYITNVFSYSGAAHSINYVYTLGTKFGFKVTHASYSEINIPELNKKLVSETPKHEIASYILPPKLVQCSDLSKFPNNFK